jgi:hypothetical protein
MHGYSSATVINDIAEGTQDSDKPLVALYIGDWDPSGLHMSEADLPERLKRYGADLLSRRIALVEDDLRGLPHFDVRSKAGDPRYQWFLRRYRRSRCYELDAMNPNDLRRRVREQIERFIDRALWDRAVEVERVEVESMHKFQVQWQQTQRRIRFD